MTCVSVTTLGPIPCFVDEPCSYVVVAKRQKLLSPPSCSVLDLALERSHLPLIHLPMKPPGARRSKCPLSCEWTATMSCTFAHTVHSSTILGPRADMRAGQGGKQVVSVRRPLHGARVDILLEI